MWGPHGHVQSPDWMEIQCRWIKWIRKYNKPMKIQQVASEGTKRELIEKKKKDIFSHFWLVLAMEGK